MPTLTITDETSPGKITRKMTVEFLTEKVSVRELIRSRVYQEVQDFNHRQPQVFQGLVQPTDTEKTLNGFKLRTPRQIDWKKQFEKAVDAFGRNGFLLLIDDRQAQDLEEEVTVTPETRVTFLKLVPLVGG